MTEYTYWDEDAGGGLMLLDKGINKRYIRWVPVIYWGA